MTLVIEGREALMATAGVIAGVAALAVLPAHGAEISAMSTRSEFVGMVRTGDAAASPSAFVAVVVGRRRSDGKRAAHAYVCDGHGHGVADWFVGPAGGGTFRLHAVRGQARIRFRLHGGRATGTVTFRRGDHAYRFVAKTARDGGGLYHVRQTASGRWVGTSEGGNRIRAHDRGRRVIGTVTLASGKKVRYDVRQARGSGGAARYVAIVLPPRGVKGRGGFVEDGMPSSRFYLASFTRWR